jgi:quercetin dioxygenase-like cupin family protein
MIDYTQKTYGFELCWADTSLYSAYMIVIKDNEKTPYIYHKKRDKTIFVLQGEVVLHEEGRNKTIGQGECYHIPAKIMHRFMAIKGDATILEVGSANTENDIVTVEA